MYLHNAETGKSRVKNGLRGSLGGSLGGKKLVKMGV